MAEDLESRELLLRHRLAMRRHMIALPGGLNAAVFFALARRMVEDTICEELRRV